MNVFEIDGKNFDDFDGFIAEFDRVFISHVEGHCLAEGSWWNGNLDVFNDYLFQPDEPYLIRWKNSWKSRRDLGYDAMIVWLLRHVLECKSPSKSAFWDEVDAARRQEGPTLFDWIVEIINGNAPHASLELDDRT